MKIKYNNILDLLDIIIQQDNNFTELNMKGESLNNLIRSDFLYLLKCNRELEFELKGNKIVGKVME